MRRVVVVGGGLSGLATAFEIKRMGDETGFALDLAVLEDSERLGGKIWSYRTEGFLCEVGPNGFLDSKPSTLELCAKLNIENRLLKSSDEARKRFIYSDGILHRLPESPLTFFRSNLLSLPGRLRILLEPFTRPAPKDLDETIASFGRRHLGEEAVRKLIGPMVSGIFAGDPYTMSLRSCFPVMVELEREGSGSLFKAMIRRQKRAKKEGRPPGGTKGGPAGPGGILTSFEDGMEYLTEALAEATGRERIFTNVKISQIEKNPGSGFTLTYKSNSDHKTLIAEVLILATPAHAAKQLITPLDKEVALRLEEIPYAPLAVICLGYKREEITHPLDGFGFLIPHEEGKTTLGCLWDSSMYRGRAPDGSALLRVMAGGARNREAAALPDERLLQEVRDELKEIMQITAEPTFVRLFRHEKAIPLYTVGHEERLNVIEQRLSDHPGLFLTGNAYRGIGINDCTRNAAITAQKVIDFLKRTPDQ